MRHHVNGSTHLSCADPAFFCPVLSAVRTVVEHNTHRNLLPTAEQQDNSRIAHYAEVQQSLITISTQQMYRNIHIHKRICPFFTEFSMVPLHFFK